MMNQTDGWMNGWTGGGMWIWTVFGVLVVVLLVVASPMRDAIKTCLDCHSMYEP